MGKRKRKRKSAIGATSAPSTKTNFGTLAKTAACILGGVMAGSQITKFVEKKDNVSGTDLLGLDGDLSKYASGAIPLLLGAVGTGTIKNSIARNIALGITVAGAARLINAATGKSIVALGDAEDGSTPYLLPELPMNGAPVETYSALPGIGDPYEEVPGLPEPYDYAINPALSTQPLQGEETLFGDEVNLYGVSAESFV